jgi:hypothetical protein
VGVFSVVSVVHRSLRDDEIKSDAGLENSHYLTSESYCTPFHQKGVDAGGGCWSISILSQSPFF